MSILWNFDKYAKIEDLPFDPAYISSSYLTAVSADELLLKAGTPLVLASEDDGGGGGGHIRSSKKGATKSGDDPTFTPGAVHPVGEEETPTCFANEDYHFILTNPQQPKLIKCVAKGYVEQAKVLAAAGLESVPDGWADALAALGLFLVDDLGNLPGGSGGGSSGGGILAVTSTYDADAETHTLDKTWAEINTALTDKTPVFIFESRGPAMFSYYVVSAANVGPAFLVTVYLGADGTVVFGTDSENGYPVCTAS